MKVVPLGVGGFYPSHGRETSCFLLLERNTAILLDAGTGVRHLEKPHVRDLLRSVDTLHVLLSHLHLDHLSGFIGLYELWKSALRVYVPSRPLISCDGLSAMAQLIAPPFFSVPLADWRNCERIEKITESPLRIGQLDVHVISQTHRGGSIGFRIDDFAYVTDTDPDVRHIQFLHDCQLVFMETFHDLSDRMQVNREEYTITNHGYSVGNAKLARSAGVKRLGLVHINPLYDDNRATAMLKEVAQHIESAFIPVEGEIYEV